MYMLYIRTYIPVYVCTLHIMSIRVCTYGSANVLFVEVCVKLSKCSTTMRKSISIHGILCSCEVDCKTSCVTFSLECIEAPQSPEVVN